MKRKISARIICLVVAAVVLSGAVAYAAVMGSPYETLKRAVLDAVVYRNVTIDGQVTMMLDGVVQNNEKSYIINGDDGVLSYYFDENGNQIGFNYSTGGLSVYNAYTADDGTEWYHADVSPQPTYGNSNSAYGKSFFVFSAIGPEERESASIRFMELLVDALVGDLKNNVTMSSEGGIRTVRGTLTENQVPELAKAGIDMLIEQSGGYYNDNRDVSFDGKEYIYENIRISSGMKTVTTFKQNVRRMTPEEDQDMEDGAFYSKAGDEFFGFSHIDGITYLNVGYDEIVNQYTVPAARADYEDCDPLEIPMKTLTINYVHGEAEIDASGNLLSVDLNGAATMTNIFGDTHAVDINASVKFSDIGTSDPVCPIPGAEQLLTAEYAKTNYGNEYLGVWFKLNPDGSIDADSVTTTYPGELDRTMGVFSGYTTDYPYFASSISVGQYPAAAPFPVPALDPAPDEIAVWLKGED